MLVNVNIWIWNGMVLIDKVMSLCSVADESEICRSSFVKTMKEQTS